MYRFWFGYIYGNQNRLGLFQVEDIPCQLQDENKSGVMNLRRDNS
jgi:hypothetical protein